MEYNQYLQQDYTMENAAVAKFNEDIKILLQIFKYLSQISKKLSNKMKNLKQGRTKFYIKFNISFKTYY